MLVNLFEYTVILLIFSAKLNQKSSETLKHSTCVKAIGAGFDLVVPFLVLGAAYHDVPGEETHLSSTLKHRTIGQCDGHSEVSVLERFGQG